MKHTSLLLLGGGLWGLIQVHPVDESQPSVADVAKNYSKYQKITKQAVLVNPELASLCKGASESSVEAARQKYGPHAHTGIYIYMNDIAAKAFYAKAKSYPVGSVIVKQKTIFGYFDEDTKQIHREGRGVGGMIKRSQGYDSKNRDWEYFYFDDPKQIQSGRIKTCVNCHATARKSDYVFGSWRKPKR